MDFTELDITINWWTTEDKNKKLFNLTELLCRISQKQQIINYLKFIQVKFIWLNTKLINSSQSI